MTRKNALKKVAAWCMAHPGRRVHIGIGQVDGDVMTWAQNAGLHCAPGMRRADNPIGHGMPGWWVWWKEDDA